MNKKNLTAGIVAAALCFCVAPAYADPIVGMWKRPAKAGGTLEKIHKCGSSICVTVASGDHNGKRAGKFKAMGGGKYEGEITDIAAGKTYTGRASLKGNKLTMKGCVLRVLCRSETWTRQ